MPSPDRSRPRRPYPGKTPGSGRGRPGGQPPPALAESARSIALERLALDASRFPDLVPSTLDTGGLDHRDAALAHMIHDSAVRRWWTIQALLGAFLNKPLIELEARLRAALLGGVAQLTLLDRVPPHAAISETVEWAKRTIRPGAGGMVNAVLRRVAELVGEDRVYGEHWEGGRDEIPLADGRVLVLAEPVLPEDPLDRLSAAVSIPRALLESWASEHGVETARALARHTLAHAPVILNTRHARGDVPGSEPHDRPGFAVYTGEPAGLGPLLDSRDDLWVQDPASAESVDSIADLAPPRIIDYCAGKGTKTRQLSAAFPGAEIIATDTDRARFDTLSRVFEKHPRVRVIEMDGVLDAGLGWADLVLLDVPCSNTGVLARRPEAKYRFGARQGGRLVDTQRQIIADSIRLLAPGGAILYATCSLQREENRAQAEWARQWHGFTIERERTTLCSGAPGRSPLAYHDGGYSALLRR